MDGDPLRALDDYYLVDELLELLCRHGDDADATGVGSSATRHDDEKPSLGLKEYEQPPVTPVKTTAAMSMDASSWQQLTQPAPPSEAEMASWLCQVFGESFDREPRTTKSDGGTAVKVHSSGASELRRAASAGGGAPACTAERPRGRRRSRSGKVAEQRRRDKINDRLRTLQQLMPRCRKTDKASTLEEAIQYVKSLQHQVQVLSTANRYVMPILPPGVMPPSRMQLATPDVFGGQPAPMLPPYPFVPALFACPHHGNGMPLPPYRYPVGSGSATQDAAAVCPSSSSPKDLDVPSHG